MMTSRIETAEDPQKHQRCEGQPAAIKNSFSPEQRKDIIICPSFYFFYCKHQGFYLYHILCCYVATRVDDKKQQTAIRLEIVIANDDVVG